MNAKPPAESKQPDRAPDGRMTGQPVRPGIEFLLDAVSGSGGPGSSGASDSVVDLSFLGSKRPGAVSFDDPPPPSGGGGGGGVVLCRISGTGTGVGGVPVTIVAMDPKTGEMKDKGQAVLVLPEIAAGAVIPNGTIVLGHPAMLIGVESREVS